MTELFFVVSVFTAALVLAVTYIMELEEKNKVLKDKLNESKQHIQERDAIIDLLTDIRDQRDIYKRFSLMILPWCIINQLEELWDIII